MTILRLNPQPAPTQWSGTGLVFIDPAVMMAHDLFPGDMVCLRINGSNYPARVALPNADLSNSGVIQIDVGIWHLIRDQLRSTLEVDSQPENIMDVSSVVLNAKDTEIENDTGHIISAIKTRVFPVRQGYHLKIRIGGIDLFFQVGETDPHRGGVIGSRTRIATHSSDIEAFKTSFALKNTYEKTLRHAERLRAEIYELMHQQAKLREALRGREQIQKVQETIEAANQKKGEQIQLLLGRRQEQNKRIEKLKSSIEDMEIQLNPSKSTTEQSEHNND